jgi:hypothetical protein
MLIEASLKERMEAIQVPVPEGFAGQRVNPDDESIHVSRTPCYYTPDEIDLIEAFLGRLKYSQSLRLTGSRKIGLDSLLAATQQDLDRIEANNSLVSTKYTTDGSERPLLDRILIIRESGYQGQFVPVAAPVVEPPVKKVPPQVKVETPASSPAAPSGGSASAANPVTK